MSNNLFDPRKRFFWCVFYPPTALHRHQHLTRQSPVDFRVTCANSIFVSEWRSDTIHSGVYLHTASVGRMANGEKKAAFAIVVVHIMLTHTQYRYIRSSKSEYARQQTTTMRRHKVAPDSISSASKAALEFISKWRYEKSEANRNRKKFRIFYRWIALKGFSH